MSLDALRHGVQTLNDWLRTATDFEEENARLTAQLAEETTAHDQLRKDYDKLEQKAIKIQTEKEVLEANMQKSVNNTKSAYAIIDTALRGFKQHQKELIEANAREETLQVYNDALQEREEVLVAENAALKAKLEASVNMNEVRVLKHYNLPKELEHGVSLSTDQHEGQVTAESLERLQRRYDRLVAQKEKAEKKYFTFYVEWSDFKKWWREFYTTPGVDEIVRCFDNSIRGRALKGAPLRNSLASTDATPKRLASGTDALVTTSAAPIQRHDPSSKDSIGAACEDLARIYQEFATQCEVFGLVISPVTEEPFKAIPQTSDPDQTQNTTSENPPTPTFRFDLTGIPLPQTSTYLSAVNNVNMPIRPITNTDPPHIEELPIAASQVTDPDRTQNTTPGNTPTRPFRSGLAGSALAQTSLYESPVNKIRTPVRHVTPDSPLVIKVEQSPIKVPKGGPEDASAKTPTSKAPVAGPGPSTLGKRKAPVEDTPLPQVASGKKGYVPLVLQYMDGTKVTSLKSNKKQRAEVADEDLPAPKKHGKTIKDRSTNGKAVTRYEVNPDRNNGVNFAYDEVVRNKAERKRMEGADCDQCREFYKAVGPLPPRLQPPLWRSPTSSQDRTAAQPQRLCKHKQDKEEEDSGEESEDQAVKAHRQEVSRHRYIMPSGETPPGYWDLHFPNTQEVEEMRKGAEKIHRKRERFMEKEAGKKDGKYRLK